MATAGGAPPSPRFIVQALEREFRGTEREGLTFITAVPAAGGGKTITQSAHRSKAQLCIQTQRPPAAPFSWPLTTTASSPLMLNQAGPAPSPDVLIPVAPEFTSGESAQGLDLSAFTIYEDGQVRPARRLWSERDPISVALVLDTSRSTARQLPDIKAAASEVIDGLGPQDPVCLISFDGAALLRSELTADRESVRRGLVYLRPGGFGSRLYDVLVGTAERFRTIEGRKAIVLLTDGVDVGSLGADRRATEIAIDCFDILVHAVHFDTSGDNWWMPPGLRFHMEPPTRLDRPSQTAEAGRFLASLSLASGGRFLTAGTGSAASDFLGIGQALRHQHVVQFAPTTRDQLFHRVRVEVAGAVTVRARAGYFGRTSR